LSRVFTRQLGSNFILPVTPIHRQVAVRETWMLLLQWVVCPRTGFTRISALPTLLEIAP
jgi:hypothetical protein